MDTNVLRNWLGLPPGPWPPDDRELLGFGLETVSPAEVELRALEQMEKLRPHQLLHPDLVTEGMNRLAQSLITLTSVAGTGGGEAGPAAHSPATEQAPPPRTKRRRPGRATRPPTPDLPQIVAPPAEPVFEAEPVVPEVVPPKPGEFLPPAAVSRDPVVSDEVPHRPETPPKVARTAVPTDRRRAYRRLARMRKLLHGLDRLRPFLADPGEQLLTPLNVYGYLRAVREFRVENRLNGDADWPVTQGRLILTVIGHPLSIALFRGLVTSQRQALAADWARAVEELRGEYRLVRDHLRDTKPAPRWPRPVRIINDWLRQNPEWVLALLAGGSFVVAVARTALRTSQ